MRYLILLLVLVGCSIPKSSTVPPDFDIFPLSPENYMMERMMQKVTLDTVQLVTIESMRDFMSAYYKGEFTDQFGMCEPSIELYLYFVENMYDKKPLNLKL